jgi:two-component system response regulator CpxR
MTANSILLVDDDTELTDMLAEYLQPEGMSITAASTGTQGLRHAQQEDYDLIVLDVMLPGLSGFDVLRQLRESGARTPVLMLTARGDDVDRIVGLEMGADDYLPKPFNPRELLARVKAILRRTNDEAAVESPEIEVGPFKVHTKRREASKNGEQLRLTNAEFTILVTLMRSAGEVVSREALTRAALGRQLLPDDRSLDTHISNLRKKLSAGDADQSEIRSIRGSGYIFVPGQEPG